MDKIIYGKRYICYKSKFRLNTNLDADQCFSGTKEDILKVFGEKLVCEYEVGMITPEVYIDINRPGILVFKEDKNFEYSFKSESEFLEYFRPCTKDDLDAIENNKIAEYIGYLQERGYSVTATEDNYGISVDTETMTYIDSKIEPVSAYSLYGIKCLLDNDKLVNNTIRDDIQTIVDTFPQENGKPEQIMF